MLCWGNAKDGQLGVGVERSPVFEPKNCQVFYGRGLKEVACAGQHSMFLLQDGSVYTCGSNSCGQLGHDKQGNAPELVGALDTQKITMVSCGWAHSMAVNEKGQVFAWGSGEGGQLGLGTAETSVRIPRRLYDHRISQVMCGNQHCIALSRDGQLFTWGQNTSGQLGLGKGEPSKLAPQPLKSLAGIPLAQITAGGDHSFALSLSGAVFGWGKNRAGQLGLNDKQDRAVPCHIKFLRSQKVVYISCGEEHTAALTKDGGLFTFGDGSWGQLGHGSSNNELLPRRVMELMGTEVSQIACGRHHTLAFVPSSNMVYAFGCNSHGQLGTGIMRDARSPFPVKSTFWAGFVKEGKQGHHDCYMFVCFFSDDAHFKTNPKIPGIDINSVRLLFETLSKPAFSGLMEQTIKSFESLLIPQLPRSPPDVEAMRIYLILSECPLMHDSKNFIRLTIPFAMAILRLDANPSKVLDNWWSCVDGSVFTRMVDMYKRIVVFMLTGGKTLLVPVFYDNYFHATLRLLEKLHKVTTEFTFCPCKQAISSVLFLGTIQGNVLFDVFYTVISHLSLSLQNEMPPVNLCAYPFILNAQAKTTMLQTDAELQMQVREDNSEGFHKVPDPCLLHVRRNHLVSDTLRELTMYSDVDLKKPLKVIFDGEEAVDAGGVTKEFFLLLLKELMDPVYGMFTHYKESNLLWFSDKCFVEQNWFHLIGIICGLAIYNSTVVDLHFPLALYKKLLDVQPTLDDFKELSPTEARSHKHPSYTLTLQLGDVNKTLTITRENYGMTEVKELIPGGESISVDKNNRTEFVDAYLRYVFSDSVKEQYAAFSSGFLKVCGGEILWLFQPSELMAMVVGNNNYNWEEMEKNTVYKGEYTATHPTVRLFWEVFHEFPLEKKKQFLLFLTGSDRIPIHGMESLKIVIQSTTAAEHYLPVAHTCYNLLDMPRYQTKEILRRRLTQAVEQYEGFSLV
uniref:HECT domain-containing protein n=1 Tax=Sphaeramia orbicularis TaxID=375764 RepID=A0A672YT14_9TELE